jgi:hypothetical protein
MLPFMLETFYNRPDFSSTHLMRQAITVPGQDGRQYNRTLVNKLLVINNQSTGSRVYKSLLITL